MNPCIRRAAAPALLAALSLLAAACSTLQDTSGEAEAPFVSAEAPVSQEQADPEDADEPAAEAQATEGEVPLAVAESEPPR